MAWRLAKSLEILRIQINAIAPNRSKSSDGTIGDEAHSSRSSDHNPDAGRVVRALDITHDPARGLDAGAIAETLIQSKDPRIKYVIWNRRIASGAGQKTPAWVWRKYIGKNPHDHHFHVSVVSGAPGDSTKPWNLQGLRDMPPPDPAAMPAASGRPFLVRGTRGNEVVALQRLLIDGGFLPALDPRTNEQNDDAIFGPATEKAVKSFQRARGLVVDGKVGDYTWTALLAR